MIAKSAPILLIVIFLAAVICFLNPVNGLAIYIAAGIAVWIYAKPLFGFYLVFLMAPIENINFIYDSPLRIVSEKYSVIIFPVAMTAMSLLMRKTEKGALKEPEQSGNILVFLAVILGWAAISYIWTLDVYHGVNALYNLGVGIAVYFLVTSFVREKETLEKAFKALVCWGFVLAIVLFLSNKVEIGAFHTEIMDNLYFDTLVITHGQRASGFAPTPRSSNTLGFISFLGVALYPKVRKNRRWLLFLLGLFFISCIISTGSKGGTGAFLIAMLFFLFIHPGVRKKAISLTALFLFCFAFVLVFNSVFLRSNRFVASAQQAELSLAYRLEFWKAGLGMMSNTWIGAGAGGFASIVDPWPGAHSFYFSTLFDLGIIGLVMLLVFVAYIFIRLRRAIVNTEDRDMKLYLYCMVSSLILFLIHGTVDMSYDTIYFWMLAGTVMAVVNIAEKKQQTAVPTKAGGA